MKVEKNISLKRFNTFAVDVTAGCIAGLSAIGEIHAFLATRNDFPQPFLILGGGSNVLFTRDFEGTVLLVRNTGHRIVRETDDHIYVQVAAGELWDDFVKLAVMRGWGGVENLSLIPGYVGASPIQNIGAYGVELREVIHEIHSIHLETGEEYIFSEEECGFGYRESRFKSDLRGEFIITGATFRLSKEPVMRLDYSGLRDELQTMNVVNPGIADVREAVCRIRRRKLPDPVVTGNAGSFFKNPVVSDPRFEILKKQYPELKFYPDPGGKKIPAAWLIEQCGWKGKRTGDAGVHPEQPLVLINYGKASGKEILDLATLVRQSVYIRFDILLEPEVTIL
jgi:UDP-N-acetylmuramate dehydrogenase